MEEKKEKAAANLSKAKDITKMSYVPIAKENLKNKNYLTTLRAMLDNYCSSKKVGDNIVKTIKKKDLRSLMRQVFNLQSRKINTVLDTYESLGILSEEDKDTYIVNFVTPFITLDPETVQYCLTTLSELSFKVYCYLKNQYELWSKNNNYRPWMFSVSGEGGLLEICGYSKNGGVNNKKRMGWVLETLQNVKLIEISDPFPLYKEDGTIHGNYRYLYKVNDRSVAQIKVALQEFIEDYIYEDYSLEDQPCPLYVDGNVYLYDKKAFSNRVIVNKLLEDSRNLDAITFALNVQDVPRHYVNTFTKREQEWTEKK